MATSALLLLLAVAASFLSSNCIVTAFQLRSNNMLSNRDTVLNDRPILGILTQPFGTEQTTTGQHAYIAASYVKFLESAGARVVPVFHNESEAYLRDVFGVINGLLLPGGGSNILNGTELRHAGRTLYNLALEANDRGDVFPIWGTCMGFEELSLITAEDDSVLCSQCFTTDGMTQPINFTAAAKGSRLWSDLALRLPGLYAALGTETLTANSNRDGILTTTYASNVKLSSFYTVLSTNTDPNNGRTFASSIEGKRYPVLATQWHPEKSNFEWRGGRAVNHSAASVQLSQYVARHVVALARQNTHRFPSEEAEQRALIYNYSPIKDPNGYFEQVYLWE